MKNGKNLFANVVVSVCILVALFVAAAVIWEYHRLGVPMPAGVVTAILGMWTGELLIIALRQIFGSDVTKEKTREGALQQTFLTAPPEGEPAGRYDSDIFGRSI